MNKATKRVRAQKWGPREQRDTILRAIDMLRRVVVFTIREKASK